MKTLQIEIPEGYEVAEFDKDTGHVRFQEKPKNIMEQIKNFDDVLKQKGIDKSKFIEGCKSLTDDEKAYRELKLIAEVLNEGWTPDWSDDNQRKYYPWFEMGSSGFRFDDCVCWLTSTYVGSRLCFKTSELAKYAGTQFAEVYKRFIVINSKS